LAILAAGAGLAALWRCRPLVRETTLGPAWWWAVAAIVVGASTELAASASGSPSPWLAPLRLAAAALSFCPLLAVLGAKRPQHGVWNFVVAALWAIVALPAAEAFFLQRGQRLEIGSARGWFLALLVLLGPINYLPTRNGLASLLFAAGQGLALSEHLPLSGRTPFPGQHVAGLLLGCAALLLLRGQPETVSRDENRLWLDFRDTFGLFWALRLQERVNFVAQTSNWPVVLTWGGLRDRQTGQAIQQVDSAIEANLQTTMKGLLRRFVSGRWIADRLGQHID
jgi:hypothetical protein